MNIKKIIYCLCLVLSAGVFFTSCTTDDTEEGLAEKVFECFVNDDEQTFKRLYLKQAEVIALIDNSTIPDDMKKDARGDVHARAAFWKITSKLQFRHVRFRAFEKGVNWQDAEIIKIETSDSQFGFFGMSRYYNKDYGIEVKDIKITFLSEQDTFIMRLEDCVKSRTRGWCLTEEVDIWRKSY